MFHSLYTHEFVRIASCVRRTQVAEVSANLNQTVRPARQGDAVRAALMVFPELGLSAYAIDDLLFQGALLDGVERAIGQLVDVSRELYPVLVVGAPIRSEGRLFNAAVVIHRGGILSVVRRPICRITVNSTSGGISYRAPASGNVS
jgi:NAD+ synthase (glutamine-hydrolysing)